jgi:hypothetical protein
MPRDPYLYCDKDEVTFDDVELFLFATVRTKWPPGKWDAAPNPLVPLYGLLQEAMAECGLAERFEDVYRAMRRAAEPNFAEIVKAHEEIRQDVVKKSGEW